MSEKEKEDAAKASPKKYPGARASPIMQIDITKYFFQ